MTTATRLTAREEIRAAAASHGWTVNATNSWHDSFLRTAVLPADSPLVRFFAVTGFTPQDRVFVLYDNQGRVVSASYSTPGQQSALLGYHTDSTDVLPTGKRSVVVALLVGGLPA